MKRQKQCDTRVGALEHNSGTVYGHGIWARYPELRSDADAVCRDVAQHLAVDEGRPGRLLHEHEQILPPHLIHLVHLAG